ncbi:MAG TPA: CPXCG motif-containing cysteine-rich protein [bacterium]|nr:CPXCG motif-containing cysteine-rich protein [bacterium]
MSSPNAEFECPYCGYPNFSPLDPLSGTHEFTMDCENCCRPISLRAKVRGGELEELDVEREQD